MTDDDRQTLIAAALDVRQHAYVPYSHYPVGAALLGADGRIFTGCNVENASYPAGICAERAALVRAISDGQRHFEALVVATERGGTPCGICRQMLYEFAPDLRVLIVDGSGVLKSELPLRDLLPHAFDADALDATDAE